MVSKTEVSVTDISQSGSVLRLTTRGLKLIVEIARTVGRHLPGATRQGPGGDCQKERLKSRP
ncbi:hypothetical protein AtDm6_3325 [Acetobacter tropicalis]|uniref:Uncharacterized protein n=1 Tax=Acetobacter tropicalis TaxID=104102 RepID=A0A094YFZ7_9PROT|nr:hypothetical protein AtDm6_3325 [Acetobacter tropicalis]